MAGVVYDHAKSLNIPSSPIKVIKLGYEELLQLTDTPEFRNLIPKAERETWIDENGIDLLETGALQDPDLAGAYLTETVKPVLLELGKRATRPAVPQAGFSTF